MKVMKTPTGFTSSFSYRALVNSTIPVLQTLVLIGIRLYRQPYGPTEKDGGRARIPNRFVVPALAGPEGLRY